MDFLIGFLIFLTAISGLFLLLAYSGSIRVDGQPVRLRRPRRAADRKRLRGWRKVELEGGSGFVDPRDPGLVYSYEAASSLESDRRRRS